MLHGKRGTCSLRLDYLPYSDNARAPSSARHTHPQRTRNAMVIGRYASARTPKPAVAFLLGNLRRAHMWRAVEPTANKVMPWRLINYTLVFSHCISHETVALPRMSE
jgi:hypothetical protein